MALIISIIPYMSIRFFAITWQSFVQSVLIFFYGNLGDYYLIIYLFVIRNHYYDGFLKKSYFWQENGRGSHGGAKGYGASVPDQKVGPLGGLFGSIVISKTCFQKFRPEPVFKKWKFN